MHEAKGFEPKEEKPERKSFYTLEKKGVIKKGKKGLTKKPKEKERILSAVELGELKSITERRPEVRDIKMVNVWFFASYEVFEGDKKKEREFFEFERALSNVMHTHNVGLQKKNDRETRPYYFDFFRSPGDLTHHLEMAYDKEARYFPGLRHMPEIIVIIGRDDERALSSRVAAKEIREKVSQYIDEVYGLSKSRVYSSIAEELTIPFHNSFKYTEEEITADSVLEYGVAFWEESQENFDKLSDAAVRYLKTRDIKHLEKAFSDKYLKEIFSRIQEYDEADVRTTIGDFFDAVDRKLLLDFKDEDEYIEYRQNIASTAGKLDFKDAKVKMRKYYVETLKDHLDKYKENYEREEDFTEWESTLLQPIVVTVSKNYAFNERNMENGANLAMTDFKPEDIEKLIQLVSKIKSNPASLSARKLTKAKGEFYKSYEELIEGRAELTADTKQELKILGDIFKANNVKSVLDVGCGYGRISIPLIEQGYEVDGIDSNEKFLEKIREQIKKGKLDPSLEFELGGLMDYTGPDPEKEYDSVIYTWNTILEAFGPGNLLKSLNSAWRSLKPGGVLVFDQPTRENPDMTDGWYGHEPEVEGDVSYLSYIMTNEELKFILKIAGFKNVKIKKWTSKPTEMYPEGVKKITVSAKKPKGRPYKDYIPRFEMKM
jgi:SAM-dependent methyltransferase